MKKSKRLASVTTISNVCPSRGASPVDPTNKLLARQGNRFLVERRRSCAIFASRCPDFYGQIHSRLPPLPAGVAALSYSNKFKWNAGREKDTAAASTFSSGPLYYNLITFDCPDSDTTNVPENLEHTAKALTMLNNEVFVEGVAGLYQGGSRNGGRQRRSAAGAALCIGREPAGGRDCRFVDLLENSRTYYRAHPEVEEADPWYLPDGVLLLRQPLGLRWRCPQPRQIYDPRIVVSSTRYRHSGRVGTRRSFNTAASGVRITLASLLQQDGLLAAAAPNPLAPRALISLAMKTAFSSLWRARHPRSISSIPSRS